MSNQNIYDLPSPTKLTQNSSITDKQYSSPNACKIQQLFNVSEFQYNKSYQANVKQIIQLISQFDKFTDNLEAKVDNILIAQQNQFVSSYKQHMKKIETQFKAMENHVNKQEDLIKYYENQGKMSNLIKKVAMVEEQSKRLYAILQKKQKEIKSINLQLKVQKDQNKRLTAQMKETLKSKNQTQLKLSEIETKSKTMASRTLLNQQFGLKSRDEIEEPIKFFTTQVTQQQRSLRKNSSITSKQMKKMKQEFIHNNNSEQSFTSPKQHVYLSRTKKKLGQLITKNRQLTKFSSKILEQRSELQSLFISSVNQIKKQIMIKRKIKSCSFQDFKKQDKINILLIIISNQQLLRYVYQKIFKKPEKDEAIQRNHSSSIIQINPQSNTLISKQMKKRRSVLPYL